MSFQSARYVLIQWICKVNNVYLVFLRRFIEESMTETNDDVCAQIEPSTSVGGSVHKA
jgi:hypothetical protein